MISRGRRAYFHRIFPMCCPQFFRCSTLCLTLAALGCRHQTAEPPAQFEPNLVHAVKYEIQNDIPMDQALVDANWIVGKMFGTPAEPSIPGVVAADEELSSIVSMERLQAASGPADAAGRGLYRKHCSTCHGVTGNGRGPTAALQTPYPRDYRMGVFKFKSTPRGSKPTREDLARLIRNGIAGTAMNRIPELIEEDVQALVDYVIYLSWRGETERSLIDDAMFELDLEGGDRIIDTELAARLQSNTELAKKLQAAVEDDAEESTAIDGVTVEEYETYVESWEIAEDFAAEIAEAWLSAPEEVVKVPEPPTHLQLAESYADVQQLKSGPQAEQFSASVQRGRELFTGKIAACSKCHGAEGRGDGQTTDYDDWTKDWTTRVGLKPEDSEALVPLIARGALPPRNAQPRNFADGIFRGGSSSKDLYRRITQGIDGTPMPAATFVEGQFEQDDVWHLINFIRSLEQPPEDEPDQPQPQA